MKILVQWATALPQDWEEVDSSSWENLPKKPLPSSNMPIDSRKGWINAINVQGVVFSGDSYSVEELHDGQGSIKVTVVNNDPDDWKPSEYFAHEVIFRPLREDPKQGGAINTQQSQIIYAAPQMKRKLENLGDLSNTEIRSWSNFNPPEESKCKHGVWMSDSLYQSHESIKTVRSWRQWSEGVEPRLVDQNGFVKPQRKLGRYILPKGTRTYYHNPVTLANGAHSADVENELGVTQTGTPTAVQSGTITTSGKVIFSAITTTSEPNHTQWPTGTYRYQLDVSSVPITVSYGLLTLGNADGHFARINSGATADLETKQQIESAFTLTGLKIATTGNVSWSAGNASDRFEVLVAAIRAGGHGSAALTLELGEIDDFADGPWTAASAPLDDAIFFGSNF